MARAGPSASQLNRPSRDRIHRIYLILYNREVSSLKPIVWLANSLSRLRVAPADIRSDAGYQLDLVQRGETPTDFRPMPDVVRE